MQIVLFKDEGVPIVMRYLADGVFGLFLDRNEEIGSFLLEQLARLLVITLQFGEQIGETLAFDHQLRFGEFGGVAGRQENELFVIIRLVSIELFLQGGAVFGQRGVGLFDFGHGAEQFVHADTTHLALYGGLRGDGRCADCADEKAGGEEDSSLFHSRVVSSNIRIGSYDDLGGLRFNIIFST